MPVIITSKRDGFWRCKTQFFKEPKTFADDHFCKKDMARLEAEPMLTVEKVKAEKKETPPEPPSEKGEDAEKSGAKAKPKGGGKKK